MTAMVRPALVVTSPIPQVSLEQALKDLGVPIIPTAEAERFKRRFRLKSFFSLQWASVAATLFVALSTLAACVYGMTQTHWSIGGVAACVGEILVASGLLWLVGAIVTNIPLSVRQTRWVTSPIRFRDFAFVRAPEAVHENVSVVAKALPGITFEIDEFKNDPLLWVCRGEGAVRERCCIAQWL